MTDMNKTPTLTDAELAPAGLPVLSEDDVATVTGIVSIGASWDPSSRSRGGVLGSWSRKSGADLDVAAVLFQDGEPVTLCLGLDESLKNPLHGQPGDGSVVHSGDNTTGDGEGDDETVTVDLGKIPVEFHKIVVMVAAFKKSNKLKGDAGFQGANNVLFTVYDGTGPGAEKQFCIRPSLLGTENCVIIAILDRVGNTTTFEMRKKKARVKVEHGNQAALIQAASRAG